MAYGLNAVINNRIDRSIKDSIVKNDGTNDSHDYTPQDVFITDGSTVISTTDGRINSGSAGAFDPNGRTIVTGIGDSNILERFRKLYEQSWTGDKILPNIPYNSNGEKTPPIEYYIQISMEKLAEEILAGDFTRVSSKNLLAMLVIQKKFQEAIDKAKEHLGLDF